MKWHLNRMVVGLAVALVSAPAAALQGQEHSRFQVLIPDLRPADGSNKKFGENVAKQLRSLMDELATHQSVSRKDLQSALKEYKIDGNALQCTQARQLASLMGSQLVLCASYEQQGDAWSVTAEFVNAVNGETFTVSPTKVGEKGDEEAAQHIFNEFDRYTTQIRAATFCAEYAASRGWTQAMEQCDRALELNPNAISTRYVRARVYFETDRPEQAMEDLARILEINPVHEDALQYAGYISAKMSRDEDALGYYSRYLELSPDNAAVRMKIAYELAQAGDPAGAMQLIQEGLDQDQTNVDLWEQLGGFAFAAGQKVNEAAQSAGQDANTLAPEARSYFRSAIEAYEKVYEAKGAETPATELRSILAAYLQLDDVDSAVAKGSTFLGTHPEEAGLWSMYADALQKSGKLEDALAALDRVKEIDPAYPNVSLRQGKWLLEEGRVSDGVAILKSMATAEPGQADAAGRMVVAHAYSQGVQPKNFNVAITALNAARDIPGMSAETVHQVNFWLGYSILQGAIPEQEERTLETAEATLPKFQRARRLFDEVGDYPSKVNVNLGQILEAVNQYIAIQESIIKRGR